VLQFNSVPLGYHIALSGKLTTDYFDAIWTTDQDAGLAPARDALREVWSDIFDGFSLGLVSSHDDPVRLVGRNTPIARELVAGYCMGDVAVAVTSEYSRSRLVPSAASRLYCSIFERYVRTVRLVR